MQCRNGAQIELVGDDSRVPVFNHEVKIDCASSFCEHGV
jgi:hypothetical protein